MPRICSPTCFRATLVVLGAGACLIGSSPAVADDLVIPPWFPHPKGTYQHWDFSAGPAAGPPYAPDAGVLNPFGAPVMTFCPGGNAPMFFQENLGRFDLWQLDPGPPAASGLEFTIPNAGAGPVPKILWLQVTYWSFFGARPTPTIPGYVEVFAVDIPVGPEGWRWNGSAWVNQECPAADTVTLKPGAADDYPYIDQVVIDTICICPDEAPGGPDAVPEVELCGEDANGGCDAPDGGPLQDLDCNGQVSGAAWAEDGQQDTDWYRVLFDTPTHVVIAANAQFPAHVALRTAACPGAVIASATTDQSPAGGHAILAAESLPPGEYWIRVAPGDAAGPVLDGYPCGAGQNAYALSLSCIPVVVEGGPCNPGAGDCFVPNGSPGCEDVECCELVCAQDPFCCDVEWDQICADAAADLCDQGLPPCSCPGDLNGDGVVGAADLAILLAAWNTDGEGAPFCSPDFDNSGNVDAADLAVLLAAWGDCPAAP